MRLSNFLELRADRILEETTEFARTMPPLQDCDEATLKDHFNEILQAISWDLTQPQSRTQSIQKSRGRGPAAAGTSAAQSHGLARAASGLSITQLFAEYRALRSCVLRLWKEAHPPAGESAEDTLRFNEAIDQAVQESIHSYNAEVEHWRHVFLGILGHDLRSPLNTLSMAAELMELEAVGPLADRAVVMGRSVRRMKSLLDSLLELNRAQLGSGMALQTVHADAAAQCRAELEMLQVAYPDTQLRLSAHGETWGTFDASRVREAFTNLVTNAIRYGTDGAPCIQVEGDEAAVRISVENGGAIDAADLGRIFEPLKRGAAGHARPARTNLGLGLFITRQIARAHGGEVDVRSGEGRVRFTMTLPKTAA